MKINSSTVSMDASRLYTNSTKTRQSTLRRQAGTGVSSFSSNTFLSSYMEFSSYSSGSSSRQSKPGLYDEYLDSKTGASEDDALPSGLYSIPNRVSRNMPTIYDPQSAFEKFQQELMKQIEELMQRIRDRLLGITSRESSSVLDLSSGTQPGSLWTRQTYQSVTVTETETTIFQTTGSVITEDGRRIDFNMSMEMSRSFMESWEMFTESTEYILTDPLVIKLKDAPDTISDQKWFFDIDGDGVEEEISQLAEGNGFLALDANGNGKIDDGSELFGTKSGNGFKDLAAYDEDGNGWIDENDSVYSKLKIWVKDASGNDKLISLQEADIGAIYLGSASTQFSHTNTANDVQAVVRQSGFYLHESTGAAGAVQQIDFATK